MITRAKSQGVASILIVCCLFLFFTDGLPLRGSPVPDDLEFLILQGEGLYREGRYAEALEKFEAAKPLVREKKQRERLLLDQALAHYALGDAAKSEAAIRALLKLNPAIVYDDSACPRGIVRFLGVLPGFRSLD